ncbi:RNA methyltransferase, partial [bacterium]|nr:RNA methyltransferase [bacterium]
IKFIRKLADRKERQQSGLFFVEGLRIVGEAVQKNWEIETLVVAPELLISLFGQQLVADVATRQVRVEEVSADVFRSLSLKDGPQGIAAVIHQRWTSLDDVHLNPGDTWIALDSVQDPGNLGTILRTSDSAGCRGVILLDQSTDPFDPGTVRASMGAVFSQPMIKTSLPAFASWKKRESAAVIGTSDKGKQDYHRFNYPDKLVVLMGSERQGLQEQHLALCSEVVSIPMQGASDSLNLSVATALVVYEVVNQRRDRTFEQPKP